MKLARRAIAISSLGIAASFAPAAESKEALPGTAFKLAELEGELKKLAKDKDAAAHFDKLMKFLGLPDTCPAASCKTVSTKWTTANLDEDGDDEKVLAVTTIGGGACAPVTLTAIVFDASPKGWTIAARRAFHHPGGAKPVAEVSAANVHSAASKDLVVHLDGQCKGGTREQALQIFTFRSGKLAEVLLSEDFVGKGLVSYEIAGTAPASVELTDAKGKTKLLYDEPSFSYDVLAPYADVMKTIVTKSDDEVLSSEECGSPVSGTMATDCKLKGSAKVQVLVQQGKAIGLTVSVTPEKPSFVRCMRKEIAKTSWKSTAGATGCTRTFVVK